MKDWAVWFIGVVIIWGSLYVGYSAGCMRKGYKAENCGVMLDQERRQNAKTLERFYWYTKEPLDQWLSKREVPE